MQLIPRYLYQNKINILANDIGFGVEYRPVYSRQIKIYKGVDQKIQFKMLNADQKPVNINGTVVVFEAWDDEKDQVMLKECTIVDDGTTAKRGLCYVTITENDLLNLPSQYLSYVVYFKETCDTSEITYTDRAFDACGSIYLDDCTHPTIKKSIEVNNFKTESNAWVAGSDDLTKICAMPKQNKNEAIHTVQFYTDAINSNGYIGNIKIQGTLDNQITGGTNWYTIDTVEFDGTEVRPKIQNFKGVYSYVKFELDTDPEDKLTKILVRN